MANGNRFHQIARQYPGFVVRCSYAIMITAFAVLLGWGITQSYDQQLVRQQREVYTLGLTLDKFLGNTLSNVNLLRSQAQYFLKSNNDVKFDTAILNYWFKTGAKYGYYSFDYAPSALFPYGRDFNLYALKDTDAGAVSPILRGKDVNLGREVEMSLSIAPLLRPIYEQLSTEGRIRYTSLAALEMTYPARPEVGREGQIKIFKKIFKNFISRELITDKTSHISNLDRDAYLSRPYEDVFGSLMVTAASSVYDGDKYLGNISIDFKLEALNRFIKQLSNGDDNLLLTVNGEVLSRLANKNTSTKLQQVIKNPAVRAELLKLFKTAQSSQVTIDEYVITYHKLSNARWVLVKITPINVLVQNILIKHLPIICGVLAGITGLLSISINAINRTFTKLNKARLAAELTNNKLHTALAELELLASTDKLTGAWNRRHFEQIALAEMNRASRHKQPLSILILDIDYFKHINDNYGHQIGDAVLVKLACILKENIRASDLLTRWGGEEFIILTPFTSVNEAVDLAERLRLKVSTTNFSKVNNITISIGVAQFQTLENLTNFIKRADTALYQAKNSGRNTLVAAPSTLSAWMQETERKI